MFADYASILRDADPAFILGAAALGILLATILAEQAAPAWLEPRGGGGRLWANVALGGIGFAVEALTPLSAAASAAIANHGNLGLLQRLEIGSTPRFIASFLLISFASYLLHRAAHRWAWLWRLHRVHHSDVALDVTSAFRHHPLDRLVTLGWFTAVAIALGLSPAAIILHGSLVLLFAIPQHANVALSAPLERALCRVVITPGAHHLHHSADRRETDSNFGDFLCCWDQLFGTWQSRTLLQRRAIRLGLGDEQDLGAESATAQLLSPFRK